GAGLHNMPHQVQQTATTRIQPARWSPVGLHPDLIPIAHLESSFGLHINHAPHSKGEYHTAYGALGFKPITAHEEWRKSKTLQKMFPGLEDPAAFTAKFKQDPHFYNTVASTHYLRLKTRHGTPERAVYSWRWGTGAAQSATDQQVHNDLYVQKYRHLATQAGHVKPLGKSEDHDGIDALLDIDHPIDRRLALKSRHIEPFHLRRALEDEDPQVRLVAAFHPNLTPELIREVLS